MAFAVLPRAELTDQVVAWQAQQAGYGGAYSGHGVAVALHTGRQVALLIAVLHQHLAALDCTCRRVHRLRSGIGQAQTGKVAGNFMQVCVRQVVHQMGHGGISAPPFAEVDQLVVQVAGWFTGNARKVARVGGAPFFAVAHRAGLGTLGDGVGHAADSCFGGVQGADCGSQKDRNCQDLPYAAMEGETHVG